MEIIVTIACKKIFTLEEFNTKYIEVKKRFFDKEYSQYRHKDYESYLKSVLKTRFSSLKRRLTQMGYTHVELPYNNDSDNYNFVMSALHQLHLETLHNKNKNI